MTTHTIQKRKYNLECPNCSSTELIKDYTRAELVCHDCGLVLNDEMIDYSPDWRAYDYEEYTQKAHTGQPMTPLLHDKGLSTTISWKNRDSQGKSIPSKNRAQLYRMRKWHRRITINDSLARNLISALNTLNHMTSMLKLPRTVRENAAVIYRKAASQNLVRGRSIDGVVAATIYAACRQCNVPRSLTEITEKTDISRKEIGRNYRHLAHQLNLKLLPTSPLDFLPRFCNKLDLGYEVQEKAQQILKRAINEELTSGKGPTGLAAAVIYMASILCEDRRTQQHIAKVAGITEVTIRNHYKALAEQMNMDIPVQ